ncbi:hypothetical protein PIB30_070560 [Stylosanthes scabra]|uniref:Uncharacterized protein n=1 Tax=Stylosanthes scabra TaxID=79078 RepID=A0ABU6QNX9_9FABA|nr:hypothetical protein [Stylosanthes scabra]
MELDANGQGKDNSSNLFVRFLGQVARRITFCPISIKRWDDIQNDSGILSRRKILSLIMLLGQMDAEHLR